MMVMWEWTRDQAWFFYFLTFELVMVFVLIFQALILWLLLRRLNYETDN